MPAQAARPRAWPAVMARGAAVVIAVVLVTVVGSAVRTDSPAQASTIRSVVGLGDSVPAGTACNCDTYISLVGSALAARQHSPVGVSNLAAGGETTDGLRSQLDTADAQAMVGVADLAIVTIGANDFDQSVVSSRDCGSADPLTCYQPELTQLRSRLDGVLAKLKSLMGSRGQILITGYWNVFLDGAVGKAQGATYVARTDALTRAVNTVIAAAAAADGATYVDLYAPMKGDGDRDDTNLLAADGDHPNAAGHRVIAQAVLAALPRTPQQQSSRRTA